MVERDPNCIFCKIVAGEADAGIVYEDDLHVAFLDVRPVFKGHVLLVPRPHFETLPDLAADRLAPFLSVAQRLCRAVEEAMDAHGTFVANNNVVSQSVPHLHLHVIPRKRKDGLRGFFWPRQKYADGELAETAARIRAAVR